MRIRVKTRYQTTVNSAPIVEVLVVIPVDGIPDTYGASDASGS